MRKEIIITLLLCVPMLMNGQVSGGQIKRQQQASKVTKPQKRNVNSGETHKLKTESEETAEHRALSVYTKQSVDIYGRVIEYEVSQAVDLGLPSGTIWAGYNIGANSPEERGDYYAWGDIISKEVYTSDNYFDKVEGNDLVFKTFNNDHYTIIGTNRDVARVKWGSPWKMPNKNQFEELINHCKIKLVEIYIRGRFFLITGPNGKSILLPCAGRIQGTPGDFSYRVDGCNYWCGELHRDGMSYSALCFFVDSRSSSNITPAISDELRWHGMNVRAVK